MSSSPTSKTVLFLALSGIGNLIMQLPTIAAFKKARPDWRVIVWVAPRGTKLLAEQCSFIDSVIEGKIRRSLLGHLRFAHRLSRGKPGLTIMLSPGQLVKGAIYMFFTGADRRIAHCYPHLGNPQSDFLLTDGVVEQEGLHDIEQNLNLLDRVGISTAHLKGQPYHFSLTPASIERAGRLTNDLHIPEDKKIIGIHAGSAPDFLWKRWPLERFAHVARALIANHRAHILLFGGPAEKKQSKELKKMIGHAHASIIGTDLLTAAGTIKQCRLFLANDSGLMHLAAALNVPTVGIFGPTDERITGPRGTHSHVVRAPHTKPLYNTEYAYKLGSEPHETLLAVTPTLVTQALEKYL